MPPSVSRKPLRERCNVYLHVQTDGSGCRSMKSLNSRRLCAPPTPFTSSNELTTPSIDAPRQFIPHLFLHSRPSLSGGSVPQGHWTHILRVLPATADHRAGSFLLSNLEQTRNSPQTLTLYVVPNHEHTRLPLGRRHLMAARDFLALALPYQAAARANADADADAAYDMDEDDLTCLNFPGLLDPPSPNRDVGIDPARVLLIGPSRLLLILAVTYLAFAARCSVRKVMQAIVEEQDDAEVCALIGPNATMGLRKREIDALEYFASAREAM